MMGGPCPPLPCVNDSRCVLFSKFPRKDAFFVDISSTKFVFCFFRCGTLLSDWLSLVAIFRKCSAL